MDILRILKIIWKTTYRGHYVLEKYCKCFQNKVIIMKYILQKLQSISKFFKHIYEAPGFSCGKLSRMMLRTRFPSIRYIDWKKSSIRGKLWWVVDYVWVAFLLYVDNFFSGLKWNIEWHELETNENSILVESLTFSDCIETHLICFMWVCIYSYITHLSVNVKFRLTDIYVLVSLYSWGQDIRHALWWYISGRTTTRI